MINRNKTKTISKIAGEIFANSIYSEELFLVEYMDKSNMTNLINQCVAVAFEIYTEVENRIENEAARQNNSVKIKLGFK